MKVAIVEFELEGFGLGIQLDAFSGKFTLVDNNLNISSDYRFSNKEDIFKSIQNAKDWNLVSVPKNVEFFDIEIDREKRRKKAELKYKINRVIERVTELAKELDKKMDAESKNEDSLEYKINRAEEKRDV